MIRVVFDANILFSESDPPVLRAGLPTIPFGCGDRRGIRSFFPGDHRYPGYCGEEAGAARIDSYPIARSRPARQLLHEYGEPLVRKAMSEALKGDVPLLRTFLGYLLPRWKDAPVQAGPLPARTVADVAESLEGIVQKVGSGELSPQDGRTLTQLLATKVSVIFKTEVENRLRTLEKIIEQELSPSAPVPEIEGEVP